MKYNLTEKQKELARNIMKCIKEGEIDETFFASPGEPGFIRLTREHPSVKSPYSGSFAQGDVDMFETLGAASLLHINRTYSVLKCTVTGSFYEAVKGNFENEEPPIPVSTLAQPHPPEISMSIDRLRAKYPDPKKLGFLIMRFREGKAFEDIVKVIKDTGASHSLTVVRADQHEFHGDLWWNVCTYLHGCGFGIAVYDRIEADEPNANVGLEVGYLMAMNKPVLLLKDKTLKVIQSDLVGKLCRPFDTREPEGTVPKLLESWLTDYGIIGGKA